MRHWQEPLLGFLHAKPFSRVSMHLDWDTPKSFLDLSYRSSSLGCKKLHPNYSWRTGTTTRPLFLASQECHSRLREFHPHNTRNNNYRTTSPLVYAKSNVWCNYQIICSNFERHAIVHKLIFEVCIWMWTFQAVSYTLSHSAPHSERWFRHPSARSHSQNMLPTRWILFLQIDQPMSIHCWSP